MNQRRVVVTGLGAVSSVGNDVKTAWNAVKNGESGIDKITLFDASEHLVQIAGEVKNFSLEDYGVDRKLARKMSRFGKFLLGASIEAVKDSGFDKESISKENAGIVSGVGIGLAENVDSAFEKFYDPNSGVNRIPPMTAPLVLNNEAAAGVAMYFGIHGPAWTLSTACASGTDSLGLALDMIRLGRMDVCIAGGTDANITGFNIGCYQALSALTNKFNDNPKAASRPFDKDRSGFVMGEGAAVLILEEYEHAKARGAHIYAEVAGFGSSSDAYHITAPCPDAAGALVAMKKAFDDAGIKPEEVQYYNAHGTSTSANDTAETILLKSFFGEHAYKLKISSTKSETGHMVGAAGSMEAIFCIKAIEEGFVPPTINLDNPDLEHGCDLDYTPNVGVKMDVNVACSCSLGFGGHNSSILIKKYTD